MQVHSWAVWSAGVTLTFLSKEFAWRPNLQTSTLKVCLKASTASRSWKPSANLIKKGDELKTLFILFSWRFSRSRASARLQGNLQGLSLTVRPSYKLWVKKSKCCTGVSYGSRANLHLRKLSFLNEKQHISNGKPASAVAVAKRNSRGVTAT